VYANVTLQLEYMCAYKVDIKYTCRSKQASIKYTQALAVFTLYASNIYFIGSKLKIVC